MGRCREPAARALEVDAADASPPSQSPSRDQKWAVLAAWRRRPRAVRVAVVAGLLLVPPLLLLWQDGRAGRLPSVPENCKKDLVRGTHHVSSPYSSLLDGGLQSTGFDDNSCLSRYRYGLFRNLSGVPSAYLLHRLRQHEALQLRCGPGTAAYKKAAARLRSGSAAEVASGDCKYLVLISESGVGNRMLAAASAFLYAILTNRTLLIDRWYDVDALFCEPFPSTSWILPPDFPVGFRIFNLFRTLTRRSKETLGNLLKNGVIVSDAAGGGKMTWSTNSRRPPFVFAYLEGDDYDFHDCRFFCDDAQRLLAGVEWVITLSNVYVAPALYLVPSFETELNKLFPERELMFHFIGRYLLHPSNGVWCMITAAYNVHLAHADDRLGIQIRVFDRKGSEYSDVLDQILTCAADQRILPPPAPAANRTKAVLVTSLSRWYSEKMQTLFGSDRLTFYQPSGEGEQKFQNARHNMAALSEIYLQSLTDELITSGQSTFGYVAASLAGVRPAIMLRSYEAGGPEQQTPCRRVVSLEPCLHNPPRTGCSNDVYVDPASRLPYIKQCEDISWGVKIVD